MELITVTHRSTIENIKNLQKSMYLKANYPIPDNYLMRLLEDNKKVIWISLGQPNFWNRMWSGMIGKRGDAYIIFEVPRSKVRKPNGIKRIFSYKIFAQAQYVIEDDIFIPKNAEFIYKNKHS